MGFVIIRVQDKKMMLVELGILKLAKIEDPYLKLRTIFEKMIALIELHHPDELAIEAPFYGKNVQSMLKLGRAQGVAISAALSRRIPISEYYHKKIKQSVTGHGNASKEQVAAMLDTLLSCSLAAEKLDATDALAAAVCHFFQTSNKTTASSGKKGWKGFLAENPDKLISKT
jgi:crossover junction endodeoxyribonuclease RuvC